MKWKLDENLPAELVADLREQGHDVESAVGEGLGGADDPTLAERASLEGRTLMTLDKGLGDIRRYPPGKSTGIVLVRLRREGRTALRQAVRQALPELVSHSLAGRLAIVTEASIRFRT